MKALIFWGGWDGHEPDKVAKLLETGLKARGFEVEVSSTLDCLLDAGKLASMDVIVPTWTCGKMTPEQWNGLNAAIKSGVGLGGAHGGMGDAFRDNLEYQWMVGGQFVGHPTVGEYEVRITGNHSPITEALPQSFKYNSEQYYMLTDTANRVLADSVYTYDGIRSIKPMVWTKIWGKGRVFYSSLGHVAKEYTDYPFVLEMTLRGIAWAAQGKNKGCCH